MPHSTRRDFLKTAAGVGLAAGLGGTALADTGKRTATDWVTLGRSGVKVSGSHLHFEVHKDGELADPVTFLSAFVLPPQGTITHELAMAEKHERLARERRRARHARIEARKRLSS